VELEAGGEDWRQSTQNERWRRWLWLWLELEMEWNWRKVKFRRRMQMFWGELKCLWEDKSWLWWMREERKQIAAGNRSLRKREAGWQMGMKMRSTDWKWKWERRDSSFVPASILLSEFRFPQFLLTTRKVILLDDRRRGNGNWLSLRRLKFAWNWLDRSIFIGGLNEEIGRNGKIGWWHIIKWASPRNVRN